MTAMIGSIPLMALAYQQSNARLESGKSEGAVECSAACHSAFTKRLEDLDGDSFPEVLFVDGRARGPGKTTGIAIVGSMKTGALVYAICGAELRSGSGLSVCTLQSKEDRFDTLIAVTAVTEGSTPESKFGMRRRVTALKQLEAITGRPLARRELSQHTGFVDHRIADVGDVDGDGADDVALASYCGNFNSGWIELVSSSKMEVIRSIELKSNDAFVSSMLSLGDVNKDGYGDFAVGQPLFGHEGMEGRVVVYSGADCSVLYVVEPIRVDTVQSPQNCGVSLARHPDIDGDKICEFVYCGWNSFVAISSGADGKLLSISPSSNRSGDRLDGFGESVITLFDRRNEEIPYVVVGMHERGWGNDGSYHATWFGDHLKKIMFVAHGDMEAQHSQVSVEAYADFDSDGVEDVLATYSAGHVVKILSGLTGRVLATWHPLGKVTEKDFKKW